MNPYPNNETEDWIKGQTWPYVDADGDDIVSVAEFEGYFPDIDPVALLELPVGRAMPARLRADVKRELARRRLRARSS